MVKVTRCPKKRRAELTPLQMFQHDLSRLLDENAYYLNDVERQAALTYLVMRATIVLAPSQRFGDVGA